MKSLPMIRVITFLKNRPIRFTVRSGAIVILLSEFPARGIVFMYQALYMMISYASILCGIWQDCGIPRGA